MGLRARLFLSFLSVVLLLGGITLYTGARLITRTILREAQYRTTLDLKSARAEIDSRLKLIQAILESLARRNRARKLILAGVSEELRISFERERIRYGFDVLSFCDARGEVIARTRHPYKPGGNRALDPVVESALGGKPARGVIILYADELAAEGSDLPRQAFINFVPTPHAKERPEKSESSGMMLWAAAPVCDEDGKVIGAVYGGILLNRNWKVVDEICQAVFGNEKYDGRDLGTVTIFLWDVRIATNVKDSRGNRAIGTRVSAEVYDRVLESGMRWSDRAFVVNDWYVSSYEPIHDPRGKIIGILYTGVLEKKYRDLRNDILASFLTPILLGVVFSLVLSFLLARSIASPVRELVVASRHLADGDLDYRPQPFKSSTELQRLAESFSRMADAIKERDERLRKQNLELEKSNEQLKRLNRSYMEMLSFVSHELKNPLNAVIFGASSLRDEMLGPLNEKQKKIMETILRNAEYLEEMTANYLDLSRIETGEMKVKKRHINLWEDVVEPVLLQLEGQINSAGMQLKTDVPRDIEFQADPALLRIVMDNLLSNAVKYGAKGGDIEITATADAEGVTVSVRNDGQGIKEEDIDKLFGKFVRLETPSSKARKGTGLGLFISREIVEGHGGKIWAESEYGKWAKFSFRIPTGKE